MDLNQFRTVSILPMLLLATSVFAGGIQAPEKTMETVLIVGSLNNQIGVADSANEGTVTAKQLENLPLARTGELLEAVPGVIVTQHSGDGKANQYFARGFNLDHGTDFRTTVMGMPVNLPTNAHGQGYSDLNFIIPELVRTIQYKKGTYYAEEGDFSAAGAASFDYLRKLDKGLFSTEFGQNRYKRILVANSTATGPGTLIYAFESAGQDGPWTSPENYRRFNGYMSYSWKTGVDEFRIAGMALKSSWNATDQVPQRAIDSGLIGRFGSLDPSDGGESARYSVSADWSRHEENGDTKANAYFVKSRLDLYSDFTFMLDDPINGDQFHQSERREIIGLNAEHAWAHKLGHFDSETSVGVQLRQDRMSPVALYSTAQRQLVSTTREDHVTEEATGIFISNATRWAPWFRTVAGLRSDWYSFDVNSNRAANSGKVNDAITSPKFTAIFSPIDKTELYLNWGQGFHSNDARGTTITVDPKTGLNGDSDGNAIMRATPLVKATGKEVGIRSTGLVQGLQTSLSVWQLSLASELVFSGDAGTTEASRPSRRNGVELANYYVPAPGWIIDADLAWSRARFSDNDPVGPFIPGAIDRTASVGISGEQGKWSGGLRLRYFGGRSLIEDDTVRSSPSTLANVKAGYTITKDVKFTMEVLNLFDRKVSDIDYYYESQLRGEPAPVADIHTHPAEPRAFRMGLVMKF